MTRGEMKSLGVKDWLLRAAWVYTYACLIVMFEILRRIEGRSGYSAKSEH
jgi:hypothetical protein